MLLLQAARPVSAIPIIVVQAFLLLMIGLASLLEWIGPAAAQSGPAPVLRINAGAKQAILSWPTNASGFVLETANSLAEPVPCRQQPDVHGPRLEYDSLLSSALD